MVESIDGRIDCGMVDGISDQTKMPTKLKLQSVERLENDILWIKYELDK